MENDGTARVHVVLHSSYVLSWAFNQGFLDRAFWLDVQPSCPVFCNPLDVLTSALSAESARIGERMLVSDLPVYEAIPVHGLEGGSVQLVRRSLSRYLVALTVLLWCAAPARAADVSKIHIDNFGKVSDTYYRGGQPSGSDYAALAAAGIKTIINLTSDDAQANEKAMTEAAGMTYIQIPMTTHVPPTPLQIAQFLAIVNAKAAQPVYVHCVGGRHRTGVMTAIYRMTDDGWSTKQAFAEMKQYKFGADFLHAEFKDFILGYPAEAAHAAAAAVMGKPVTSKSGPGGL